MTTSEGADPISRRTAIVTGAANGIGFAIAAEAARRGYRVVTSDIHPIDATAGCDAHVVGDLRDPHIQEELLETALHGLGSDGHIYALFNNVGVAPAYIPTLEISADRWTSLWNINVTIPFQLSQRVGAVMIEAGEGVIVNTSSLAGLAGIARATDYVATKHAIVGITKSLAIEWGPFGIRVNAVAPGLTATDSVKAAVDASSPGLFDRRARGVPLGRVATPEDQARAALYLASDDAAYISGTVLVVDGGTLAQHPGYAMT